MTFSHATVRLIGRALGTGLLLVLPLVFYRGFSGQFTFTKNFLAALLIFLGLGGGGVGLVLGKLPRPKRFALGFPLALWTFAVLVSCINSTVPAFSLREAQSFLWGPVWVLLLLSWGEGEGALRGSLWLASSAGTIVAFIAILQWLGHDPLLFGGYRVEWGSQVSRMRLYSTLGNPDFVAGYLAGTLYLAFGLGLAAQGWAKAGWFTAAGAMIIALMGTGSRGAWAGILSGLLVLAFACRNYEKSAPAGSKKNGEGPGVGVGMKAMLPMAALFAVPVFHEFWLNLLSSAEGRLYLWRVSWPMFTEHPWIGSGWGTFQLRFLDLQATFLTLHPDLLRYWSNVRQLHNDPLQLLLETGVLGLAAFGWVLWAYWRELRCVLHTTGSRRIRLWLIASSSAVVSILVDSLFNMQFSMAATFIVLFTILAFPVLLRSGEGKNGEPPALKRHWRSVALGVVAIMVAGILVLQVVRRALADHDYVQAHALEARSALREAAESYRRGLVRDPWNGRLHFGLARVLYLQESFDDALVEVHLAERTYQDSHLEVLKAKIQDQMGRTQPALVSYRRALALDPNLKTVQTDIQRLSKP